VKSDLSSQVAIVTGAAGGIGQTICQRLFDCGAQVVYADINLEGAEALAADKEGCNAIQLDIRDGDAVDAAVKQIVERYGKIDVLINNAGVNTLDHRVTIDEFPREEWQRIVDTDLNGLYEMSRFVAREMRAKESGRIINISSVGGIVPMRLQCAFVAAKAAVNNLTRAMAMELAPFGILVNSICPGSIMTEGTRKLMYGEDGQFNANVQQFMDHISLGRPGTTDEIAVAVQFLCDPENSYMTGHIMVVDGGWTAGYHRDF